MCTSFDENFELEEEYLQDIEIGSINDGSDDFNSDFGYPFDNHYNFNDLNITQDDHMSYNYQDSQDNKNYDYQDNLDYQSSNTCQDLINNTKPITRRNNHNKPRQKFERTSSNSFNCQSHCNPTQANIKNKFKKSIKLFGDMNCLDHVQHELSILFRKADLLYPETQKFSQHICDEFKKFEDKPDKINIISYQVEEIKIFILNIIKQINILNQEKIDNYASSLNEFIRGKLDSCSFIFPISDIYLFELPDHCVTKEKLKIMEKYSSDNKFNYIQIMKDCTEIQSFKLKKKLVNKDSNISTNNLAFNLLHSLYQNIMLAYISKKSWRSIYQCPCCSFKPKKHKSRDKGERSSLIKHRKTCPGLQLRNNDKEIFPTKSFWSDPNVASRLS